uniref:Uncharacterized protein n=1 Tax=Amphimedon queenslandica TaxID=400682 RepID=A0A1X7UVI8_AMPQE
MAAKQAIHRLSSAPLLKLEEQLTCPVCLDHYTNPKSLPCLHSFCQDCLERLPLDKKNETYYLSCPACYHRIELPEKGAGAFPVAFHLNNLKDLHSLMTNASYPQQVTCDNCTTANVTGYCKDCSKSLCTECDRLVHKKWGPTSNHQLTSLQEVTASTSQLNPEKKKEQQYMPTLICSIPSHDEPLKYFCDTCNESICHDCAILAHRDHKYNLIAESYIKHKEELKSSLKPIKEKIEALKKVMSAIGERESEIKERGERVLKEIHEMVEEMVDVLHESEKKLTEQARKITDDKLKVLSEQMKSSKTCLSLLEDVERYVEQNLKTGSPQEVLSSKKEMINHMDEMTKQINLNDLHPMEKADIRLFKNSNIIESLHKIGDIVFYSLQNCSVKIEKLEHFREKSVFSFLLSMEAPDSSLLSVPLSSLRCSLVPAGKSDQPIHTTVTTTSTVPGVYRIQCNPSTSGTHTVKVQVYDVHLEDTSLVIPFNPYLDNITPVHDTITKLNGPWEVAVSNDNCVLVVTEYNNNSIKLLNRKERKMKTLGKGWTGNASFFSPRGIAITQDKCILVCDNHRIQKISMDGNFIASFGEMGSGLFQFSSPEGMSISPVTEQVFIADCGNHRIQVLSPNLNFSHSFGSRGSAKGYFNKPTNVSVDSQGLVYIADWGNHRIQKFTPDGNFITQFGGEGSNPGQLINPAGITINNFQNLVYVCDNGNSLISIFTTSGVFVCNFGEKGSNIDQFDGPRGLTFDKDGLLFICDFRNNRIAVM